MSCKDKLVNLPSLSDIDSQFKKLTPSNLDGMSDKLKNQSIAGGLTSIAGSLKNQIGTQVGNFVGGVTGALGEVGGLFNKLGTDMKAGIPSDLHGMKVGIANALTSAKNELQKQLNGINDLISCEDETTNTNHSDTQETSKIKSAVMATSISQTKSLTNKDIKEVSENPAAMDQKTQQITNNTISNGAPIIASAQSNTQITTTQNKSLSALQTTCVLDQQKFSVTFSQKISLYVTLLDKLGDKLNQNNKKYSTGSYNDMDMLAANQHIRTIGKTIVIPNSTLVSDRYNLGQISFESASINFNIVILQMSLLNAAADVLRNNNSDYAAMEVLNKGIKDQMDNANKPPVINIIVSPIKIPPI